MLDVLGDDDEAERWLLSGLDLYRSVLGADHPEVALWEIKLGYHWSERRRYDDAEGVLRAFGDWCCRRSGTTMPARRCAISASSRWRASASTPLTRCSWKESALRQGLGDDGPPQRAARLSQGWALVKARRFAEAKSLLERLVAEAVEDSQSLTLRTALKYLGEAERELGTPGVALEHHRRALEIERRVYGKDEHLAIASSRYQIALDLLAMGDAASWADAAGEIAIAITVVRKLDREAPRLDDFLLASARIARRRGDREAARRDLSEALARYSAHDGLAHPRRSPLNASSRRSIRRAPVQKSARVGPSPR